MKKKFFNKKMIFKETRRINITFTVGEGVNDIPYGEKHITKQAHAKYKYTHLKEWRERKG